MITPWSWQSHNGWCKIVIRCKSWSVHDHPMIRIMIMIADPHDNVLFCSDFYDLPYHSQHVQGSFGWQFIIWWLLYIGNQEVDTRHMSIQPQSCQLKLWEIVGLPMPNFAKNGNTWALSGNSDVVWLWDNNHVHSWCCDHIMIRIGLLYILLLWLTHDWPMNDDDDHALGMITAWSG